MPRILLAIFAALLVVAAASQPANAAPRFWANLFKRQAAAEETTYVALLPTYGNATHLRIAGQVFTMPSVDGSWDNGIDDLDASGNGVGLLARLLGLQGATAEQGANFRERVRRFLVVGAQEEVTIAASRLESPVNGSDVEIPPVIQNYESGEPDESGYFETFVNIENSGFGGEGITAVQLLRAGFPDRVEVTGSGAGSSDTAIFFIEPVNGYIDNRADQETFTVIANVDDTLRITQTRFPAEANRATFFEQFEPITGMPAAMQAWETELRPTFHYLTNAPFPLYEAYREFLIREYPPGSLSMRQVHLPVFPIPESANISRQASIERIFETFNSTFIMVVDSSDTETLQTYGRAARTQQEDIACIYIRGRSVEVDRADLLEIFQGLEDKVVLFEDGENLAGVAAGIRDGECGAGSAEGLTGLSGGNQTSSGGSSRLRHTLMV